MECIGTAIWRSLAGGLATLMGLAACSADHPALPTSVAVVVPTVTRDTVAPFQTDTLSYTLKAGAMGYEVLIPITFTNRGPTAASITNCGGATSLKLEAFVDGQWKYAWSPIIPACLSAPIVVPPGGTWRSAISVFGAYPNINAAPKFASEQITGVYRAVYLNIAPATGAGYASNSFVLVAPAR